MKNLDNDRPTVGESSFVKEYGKEYYDKLLAYARNADQESKDVDSWTAEEQFAYKVRQEYYERLAKQIETGFIKPAYDEFNQTKMTKKMASGALFKSLACLSGTVLSFVAEAYTRTGIASFAAGFLLYFGLKTALGSYLKLRKEDKKSKQLGKTLMEFETFVGKPGSCYPRYVQEFMKLNNMTEQFYPEGVDFSKADSDNIKSPVEEFEIV